MSRAGTPTSPPRLALGNAPSYLPCAKGQRSTFGNGVTEPPLQLKVAGLVPKWWWRGVQLGICRM